MEQKILYTKKHKNGVYFEYDFVKSIKNCNGITIYNYYKIGNEDASKSTFNKYAMLEYMKSLQLSKKTLKEFENNM